MSSFSLKKLSSYSQVHSVHSNKNECTYSWMATVHNESKRMEQMSYSERVLKYSKHYRGMSLNVFIDT